MKFNDKPKSNIEIIYLYAIDKLQLTIFYYIAYIGLFSTIRNELHFKRIYLPKFITSGLKYLKFTPFPTILTPEGTILFYYLLNELIIKNKSTKISLLIRFNVVLICILTMLTSLFISYWDLFFDKELENTISKMKFAMKISENFYIGLFYFLTALYAYFYTTSILGIYPKLPGLFQNIIDGSFFYVNKKKYKK